MEIMFTVVFVLELMWNMLVHWFWEFFSDGWNLFDGVVVTVSLVSLAVDGTNFKAMRLLPVLRALRLVARLESRLLLACTHADEAQIRTLLRKGASANAVDDDGHCALYRALRSSNAAGAGEGCRLPL